MGSEHRADVPERRTRADVYSSARIGAATAFTLVVVALLVLDVGVPRLLWRARQESSARMP
jgi:hypothetical protein